MNYREKLERLEQLKVLVEKYTDRAERPDDSGRLHQEICETYGEVAEVYEELMGRQKVEVLDRGTKSVYPNYFEAGFFSGRTFHTHQGKTELLKVIGKLKTHISEDEGNPLVDSEFGHHVFLVHGHDEGTLHACARFLEKLDLPVVILREEPNQGRTIIEKFEHHSNVGFAVVLLTADDRGGVAGQKFEEQRARARQNVIFELGFFLGRLGRKRVCALYAEGVEIPSDYQGVVFVPLDDGQAWMFHLAKEMAAAGLPVDLNKAI